MSAMYCGLCLYGSDIGVPGYDDRGPAYINPECPDHGPRAADTKTGDYEIRVQDPGPVAMSYGCDYPLYVVWDVQADRRVPFSNYRRHDQAVARIIRMRDRRDR